MTKTADEIVKDAEVEAGMIKEQAEADAKKIIAEARAKAKGIAGTETEKDERTPKPGYKMADNSYDEFAIVVVKATPKAKFHDAGKEYSMHGKQAEMLIQKGEVEFVKVQAVAPSPGKHAIPDRRIKPAVKA